MKNEKFCFSKRLGILVAFIFFIIACVGIVSYSVSNTSLSTQSKAHGEFCSNVNENKTDITRNELVCNSIIEPNTGKKACTFNKKNGKCSRCLFNCPLGDTNNKSMNAQTTPKLQPTSVIQQENSKQVIQNNLPLVGALNSQNGEQFYNQKLKARGQIVCAFLPNGSEKVYTPSGNCVANLNCYSLQKGPTKLSTFGGAGKCKVPGSEEKYCCPHKCSSFDLSTLGAGESGWICVEPMPVF